MAGFIRQISSINRKSKIPFACSINNGNVSFSLFGTYVIVVVAAAVVTVAVVMVLMLAIAVHSVTFGFIRYFTRFVCLVCPVGACIHTYAHIN